MNETATVKQMRKLDELSIELGHNLMQMTELAGYNLASFVGHRYPARTHKNVFVMCGGGNNGAGGLCAAKHLISNSHNVTIFINSNNLGEVANHHLEILKSLEANVIDNIEEIQTDVIVDCLIGTGLKDNLRDSEISLIKKINDSTAISISLDVPSGLNAENGLPMPIAVQAEHTAILAIKKKGLTENEFAGILHVYDIGIPRAMYEKLGLIYPF